MFFNLIRIISSILLLFAIFNHPYSYYELLRVVVFITSGTGLYFSKKSENNNWAIVFLIIAIVFNPIIPFHFNKGIWSVIDISTSIIIVSSIFYVPKQLKFISKNIG